MKKMLEKEGEFVYYDFETRTDVNPNDGSKYYTPNCCVLQIAQRKHQQLTFMDEDCVEKLMELLFFGKKSLLDDVAHNARGFDGHILLCGYLKQTWVKPKIIFDGSRLKQFKVGRMVFLDSSCYIQEKLRTFTKTFNVATGKLYFPHATCGIPDKNCFWKEDVKTNDFNEWYVKRSKGLTRNFQRNLKKILRCRHISVTTGFRKISQGG